MPRARDIVQQERTVPSSRPLVPSVSKGVTRVKQVKVRVMHAALALLDSLLERPTFALAASSALRVGTAVRPRLQLLKGAIFVVWGKQAPLAALRLPTSVKSVALGRLQTPAPLRRAHYALSGDCLLLEQACASLAKLVPLVQ